MIWKKIKMGTSTDALISSVDFYHTFVIIAGDTLPCDQSFL